jgi:hypothetical protein
MNDLSRFFLNPFDSRNVSLSGLLAFTTDHLARLAANDAGGVFAARRAATAAALAAVEQAFTDDETKLGLRKARKQTARAFRKALPAAVARINVAVKAKFGERSPEVAECFPEGRTGFARCPQDSLENHLETLSNGLKAHATDLDAAVLAQAEDLRTNWLTVRQSSQASSGVKAAAEAGRRNARRALQRELFLNLLAQAQNFPLQPEKLNLFMQPSRL